MVARSKFKIFVFMYIVCVSVCDDVKSYDASQKDDRHGSEHIHHLPHRYIGNEHWLYSFGWNVIGYAVILIPAFFIIRMIKTSNFYERDGEGFVFNTIQCCVFGNGRETVTSQNALSRFFRCIQGDTRRIVAFRLVFCAVGLQASYLTWGVMQEKIMTKKYGVGNDSTQFTNSEFLVFTNRIFALIVAAVYVLFVSEPNWSGPFYKFSFSSLSNICSSWCQYEALKFVSFPTQVLGKTTKMIPVMIMGRFVSQKKYQYYEYVVAVMISIGVSLFLLATGSDKHYSAETTVSGLVLMVGYMAFDSFTSNWQSKLFSEHRVSSMQMMFNVNTFSALFTAVPLLLSGGMFSSILFMANYSEFMTDALIISFTSATGQLFIFYTISQFGPLVFTLIMVTRQMLAILLSCIIYGHYLSAQAILGVGVVFVALFLQLYAKHRINQKKLQQQPEKSLKSSDMV